MDFVFSISFTNWIIPNSSLDKQALNEWNKWMDHFMIEWNEWMDDLTNERNDLTT